MNTPQRDNIMIQEVMHTFEQDIAGISRNDICPNGTPKGLRYLGRGAHKYTFHIVGTDYVVKFMRDDTRDTNKAWEYEWAQYLNFARLGGLKYFAESMWGDDPVHGTFMIQQMAKIGAENRHQFTQFRNKVEETYGLVDIHTSNVGTIDGNLVVTDWGWPPEERDGVGDTSMMIHANVAFGRRVFANVA